MITSLTGFENKS